MSDTVCSSRSSCACHNLNDREVRKRKLLGYSSMVIAFALVGLGKVQQAPDWVQAMPAVPFFVAYLGLLQARTRTCVALAFAEQDMSEGVLQPTPDRKTSRRLKKRSAKVIATAAALAVISTAICWWI